MITTVLLAYSLCAAESTLGLTQTITVASPLHSLGEEVALSADGSTAIATVHQGAGNVRPGPLLVLTRGQSGWQVRQTISDPVAAPFGISGDGRIFFAYSAGMIRIWGRAGDAWLKNGFGLPADSNPSAALSADGRTIAIRDSGPNNSMSVVNVFERDGLTWARRQSLTEDGGWLGSGLVLSGDGKTLVATLGTRYELQTQRLSFTSAREANGGNIGV